MRYFCKKFDVKSRDYKLPKIAYHWLNQANIIFLRMNFDDVIKLFYDVTNCLLFWLNNIRRYKIVDGNHRIKIIRQFILFAVWGFIGFIATLLANYFFSFDAFQLI